METSNNKFMDNIRKINQSLIGFEAVSYWIYVIIALAIFYKYVFNLV